MLPSAPPARSDTGRQSRSASATSGPGYGMYRLDPPTRTNDRTPRTIVSSAHAEVAEALGRWATTLLTIGSVAVASASVLAYQRTSPDR